MPQDLETFWDIIVMWSFSCVGQLLQKEISLHSLFLPPQFVKWRHCEESGIFPRKHNHLSLLNIKGKFIWIEPFGNFVSRMRIAHNNQNGVIVVTINAACSLIYQKLQDVQEELERAENELCPMELSTLISRLLKQPSTTPCGDWLEKNCVKTDSTGPPIPSEQSLQIIPPMLTLPIAALKSIYICSPGSLPTRKCIVWSVRHTQKSITSAEAIHVTKHGDLKHSSMFHKPTKSNRQQSLKHLWQYRCCGSWCVIGCLIYRWTFLN